VFISIVEQACTFLPFALGVYLSYVVLNRADLTVEGSFVLGGVVYAKLLILGISVGVAVTAAILAGILAGICVSILQYRDRVSSLIAGILILFMLQSITLILMGRPNIPLLDYSYFSGAFFLLTTALLLIVAVVSLMKSQLGLMLTAFGDNSLLMSLMGHKAEKYRMVGLCIGNGLAAFSGLLTAQYQGFADVGMGTGLALIGIGTVIIGQQMIPKIQKRAAMRVFSCLFGVLLYFVVVHSLVRSGINPMYMKLAIGIAIASMLYFQRQKGEIRC